MSTHVDDLKGTGHIAVANKLLASLEAEFGKLKTAWNVFEHCGIHHVRDVEADTLEVHQNHYAQQLKLMDPTELAPPDATPLTTLGIAQYQSLLGGAGWLIQTRLDVAVYICALQRAAKCPRVEHAKRLNKVVKWVKRKKARLFYRLMRSSCRIIAISDSAFRKTDSAGLAMRGAIIAIGEQHEAHPRRHLPCH